MFTRILAAGSISLALLLSGCATPTKMAFSKDTDTLQTSGKPIFLMTATIKNNYKPSFQPKLMVVNVEKEGAKTKADRINFTMDDKAKLESGTPAEGNTYLLRMELEQGEYVIRGLGCQSMSFPIVGQFFAPLHSTLKSAEQGVYYLGHIDATVRERKNNEFRAGSAIPLIDQSVAGASNGTFEIEISDQWEKDGPQFQSKFPVLSSVAVQKIILPPFDRAKAQQWWEAN